MKITQIITISRILITVIPAIRTLIDYIERPGHGKEKKQAVMRAVDTILDAFDLSDTVKAIILGIVDVLIDIKIQILNLDPKVKPDQTEPNP